MENSSPNPSFSICDIQIQKKISLGFAKTIFWGYGFSQNRVRILPRHTARTLGGQNPKKKNVLSILEKIHPRENQKKQGTFFLGVLPRLCEAVVGRFIQRF